MPYDVTRTELIWPGKYDEEGRRQEPERASLPFQVIERVNESRATREAAKARTPSLFDVWKSDEGETFDTGWRNKLIWGENRLAMEGLLESFSGKINLVYIDPPFLTGADFTFEAEVGGDSEKVFKDQSAVEEKAYRDTWGGGVGSYIDIMSDRLRLIRQLLADDGSLYVHLDPTVGHYVKIALDEAFGRESFQREIIWRIGWISGYKSQAKNWIRNHDNILFYVKDPSNFTFNKEYVPYPDDYVRRGGEKPTGKGYPIEDVWNANEFEFALSGEESLDSIQIKSFSTEKSGYPTQKNVSLLRRIIRASSKPGDLVADFFAGSGTTMVAAERLDRRWIGCDLGRYAVHVSRKRLLDLEDCRPFEVLNLGKYERQYWQVATFGEDLDDDGVIALWEYIAFVLKLYGAVPTTGLEHLHGKLATAFVHVGAVDAPVTIDEIDACVEEALRLKASDVHILGWEWEMGLHDPKIDEAKARGVKLLLKQIPREVMEAQAVEQGDVEFFELAYLDVALRPTRKKGEFRAKLENFVIPNPELVPAEVRSKITKWSDYVDYWAIDWAFGDDTFIQGWVTYRTRRDRTLLLESDAHAYDEPGTYNVMVKVIDIFGNDTSKIVPLTVE